MIYSLTFYRVRDEMVRRGFHAAAAGLRERWDYYSEPTMAKIWGIRA